MQACGFRFRFKVCDRCGDENDIAARLCAGCEHVLVDADKRLKEAMALKDAHVLRVDSMLYVPSFDKKGHPRLEVKYYDVDGNFLSEYFYLDKPEQCRAFYFNFIRIHNRVPGRKIQIKSVEDVLRQKDQIRKPLFVVARKQKYFWSIREKIFD